MIEREFVRVNVAVLTVGDTGTDEATATLIAERLVAAGHAVVVTETVRDSQQLIRAHFLKWIADPEVDVVFVNGGVEAEATGAALEPLITKKLDGFSDLFRLLSYEEIGTAAMLVDAHAAQCGSTYVFVLPATIGAVQTALDRILIPQLDHRTKPKNLVMRLPRVMSDPRHARPGDPPMRPTPQPAPRPTPQPPARPTPLPSLRPTPLPSLTTAALPALAPTAPVRPTPQPPVRPTPQPTAVKPPPWIMPKGSGPSPAPPVVAAPAAAAVPVVIESAPTQKLPMPTVTPAPVAFPPKEITAVGPPPPPARRAATSIPDNFPNDVPAVAPAIKAPVLAASVAAVPSLVPAPAAQVAKPAEAAPEPESDSESEPESEPDLEPDLEPDPVHVNGKHAVLHAATASESEAASSLGARVIDSSTMSATTGTITSNAELPTFRGDMFPAGRRRVNRQRVALVLIAFALAAVCVAGLVTFIRDRNREATASVADHRDRIAAAARMPPPMPAPQPTEPQVVAPPPEPEIAEIEIEIPNGPMEPDPAEPVEPVATVDPVTPPPPIAKKPPTRVATAKPPSTKPPATRKPAVVKAAIIKPPPPPVSPVIAETKPAPPTEEGCDEVSCVLERYKLPCCQRYKPAEPAPKIVNGLPETLDRAMVTSGISKLKPVVIRCGERAGIKGTVKLAIEVGADGQVTDVGVTTTPDDALGACVAAAIRKATFARTQNGASFGYPFAF